MTETPMLSPKALAAELAVSTATIYRWVNDGRLVAVRTPGGLRFRRRDVDAFLVGNERRDVAS